MTDLAGKTAVVTGAGSGIGREIALGLVRRGVRVAGLGRREEALAETAAEAGAMPDSAGTGPVFLPVRADLRVEDEVKEAMRRARERFGPVSILVNNAGVAEYASVGDLTTEQWDRMMETNLRAPFLLTRELLPEMIAAGEGRVLMIVSVAAIKTFPGCGAYGASKAGLLGFTRVLRMETQGSGVWVTALLPGATDTPMWGASRPAEKRLMPASAVAEAALWALTADPGAVPEEIVLRPPGGDL